MNPSIKQVGDRRDHSARTGLARLAKFGFYPIALGLTLGFIYLEHLGRLGASGGAYPLYLGATISAMLALEWLIPMRPEWGATWRGFLRRDIPMMLINGAAIGATTHVATALARQFGAPNAAAINHLPWYAQAALAILISDFLWYWVHRHSHEGRGRLGQWLWKTHVLHHLPEQVYVLMHPVGHPINSTYVRLILMLPALALGISEQAIFAAAVLTGFQGLVSHFNVEIRAGWLNRVFMGTELHRHHHSAAPAEGGNYGAVITLWDQLFGTFHYRPGMRPAALGVHERRRYPRDDEWGRLLALPFRDGPR